MVKSKNSVLSVLQAKILAGLQKSFLKSSVKRGLVSLRLTSRLRGRGSGNVSQISSISPGAKKLSRSTICVLKNPTFVSLASGASVLPFQSLSPFMSTPTKLRSGKRVASPTEYSPRPQASSTVMGRSFLKYCSFHLPLIFVNMSLPC